MPDNTKNEAEARVTKTPTIAPRTEETAYSLPAEQPVVAEWSSISARFAAIIADVPTKFRSGPVEELIREIEAGLAHPRDPSREDGDEPLSTKLRLLIRLIEHKEKEASRTQRRGGPVQRLRIRQSLPKGA